MNVRKELRVLGSCVALAALGLAGQIDAQCPSPANISIRLERPLVVRGPFGTELDNTFNEIKLDNGWFRGFSANGTTYKVDGAAPWSMGGTRTVVLTPGPHGAFDECGLWLQDTEKVGSVVHGFEHAEKACNYAIGQTHKSFAYATSSNQGLTWSAPSQIITGRDVPTAGRTTGEGDCTVVNGQDGYYYAYCLRASDWKTIVARAPVASPGPGQWRKYYAGAWNELGLGGNASSLTFLGTGAARWTNRNATLLIGVDMAAGGLKASVSCNKTSFTTLVDPLLPLDDDNWNRPPNSPPSTELIAYPSMMNYTDANNQVGDGFLLAHMYIRPSEGFNQRYLVFRDISVSVGASPVVPHVRIALSRWYAAAINDRWATTAPVPGNYVGYAYDQLLGYLMTKPHPTLATNKLEDCSSMWTGHLDHMLSFNGSCAIAGYTRLRTAGWVYAAQQAGTVPLYRCWNATDQHHFVSKLSNCEGMGTMEWLLGYALAN